MRRSLHLVAAAVCGVLATAATVVPAQAATTPSYSFSCTHQLAAGRPYTKQTVTGTVTGSTPTKVSVVNYRNTVLVSNPAPPLDNAFWGGYWKTTYHDNQWRVGTDASNNTYYLMFPETAPGSTFTVTLVSLFNGGSWGNWQNWMPCTLS
ncbi:MAG: hypothetical protein U0R80_17560 [Nocardioidaceae bacterium]